MQISSLWVHGQGILRAQQEMGTKVWLLGKRPEVQRTELGAGGNAALGPRPSPAGMQAHLSGQRGALALSFLEKNNAAGVVEAFGRLLA